MRCKFTPLSRKRPTRFMCVRCGFTTGELSYDADRINRRCTSTKDLSNDEISLVERGANYVNATMRWEAAGKPERTDEQVTEIVEKACTRCHYFSGSMCTYCGCNISLPQNEVHIPLLSNARFNKPRMATEDCPYHCKCGHSKWKHLDGPCECGNCVGFVDPRAAKPP